MNKNNNLRKKIKSFKEEHTTILEIFRFLIVGGVATVIDMFIMGIVLYIMQPNIYPTFFNVFIGGGNPSNISTVIGTACGFLCGLVVNYILSIFFVYNEKGNSKSIKGFIIFSLLSLVGLIIHTIGMFIGYDLLGINEWIVKIVLIIVVLIYNYISKKMFIFKDMNKKKVE